MKTLFNVTVNCNSINETVCRLGIKTAPLELHEYGVQITSWSTAPGGYLPFRLVEEKEGGEIITVNEGIIWMEFDNIYIIPREDLDNMVEIYVLREEAE